MAVSMRAMAVCAAVLLAIMVVRAALGPSEEEDNLIVVSGDVPPVADFQKPPLGDWRSTPDASGTRNTESEVNDDATYAPTPDAPLPPPVSSSSTAPPPGNPYFTGDPLQPGALEAALAYRSAKPHRFALFRVLGNSLPPRHAADQSLVNLKFILENEEELDQCVKGWVVNRMLNRTLERLMVDLLEEWNQTYVIIPWLRDEYAYQPMRLEDFPEPNFMRSTKFHGYSDVLKHRAVDHSYHWRNVYTINNNGARNAALSAALELAEWAFPWDGNCFVTRQAWSEIVEHVDTWGATRPYLVVPMARLTDNDHLLDPTFRPEATHEPQIAFHETATQRFDETYRYGRRPKVEIFWRLGLPGVWDKWTLEEYETRECVDPLYVISLHAIWCNRITPAVNEAEARRGIAVVSWVARLFSGKPSQEADNFESHRLRSNSRHEAVVNLMITLDEQVVRSEPLLYSRTRLAWWNETTLEREREVYRRLADFVEDDDEDGAESDPDVRTGDADDDEGDDDTNDVRDSDDGNDDEPIEDVALPPPPPPSSSRASGKASKSSTRSPPVSTTTSPSKKSTRSGSRTEETAKTGSGKKMSAAAAAAAAAAATAGKTSIAIRDEAASPMARKLKAAAMLGGDDDEIADRALVKLVRQVIKRADLRAGPFSVTHKPAPSDAKVGAHDYYSVSPHYFPVSDAVERELRPKNLTRRELRLSLGVHRLDDDNLYHFRIDEWRHGTRLHSAGSERYDTSRAASMMGNTTALALAWWFTGDMRYAERGALLVRTWFLDAETRMTPHLVHAHRSRAKTGDGVYEWSDLYWFLDAVRLLERSGALRSTEIDDLQEWFNDYYDWLETNPAQAQPDVFGTLYELQAAAVAMFIDRPMDAQRLIELSKTRFSEQFSSAATDSNTGGGGDGDSDRESGGGSGSGVGGGSGRRSIKGVGSTGGASGSSASGDRAESPDNSPALQRLEARHPKRSQHHALRNMHAWLALARLGDRVNVDLWSYHPNVKYDLDDPVAFYAPRRKGTLLRAFRALEPFFPRAPGLAAHEEWPHAQSEPVDVRAMMPVRALAVHGYRLHDDADERIVSEAASLYALDAEVDAEYNVPPFWNLGLGLPSPLIEQFSALAAVAWRDRDDSQLTGGLLAGKAVRARTTNSLVLRTVAEEAAAAAANAASKARASRPRK